MTIEDRFEAIKENNECFINETFCPLINANCKGIACIYFLSARFNRADDVIEEPECITGLKEILLYKKLKHEAELRDEWP